MEDDAARARALTLLRVQGGQAAKRDELAEKRQAGLVTDAKSLFDTLRKDGSAVKDRRLRLEMNLLKGIRNMEFRWIRSEMVISDELTKDVPEEVHDDRPRVVHPLGPELPANHLAHAPLETPVETRPARRAPSRATRHRRR